ncbi:MAG: hypothetical protein SOR95_08215 [Sutterella sp.]|nr:hypothetical protein [Sutterella sp.]
MRIRELALTDYRRYEVYRYKYEMPNCGKDVTFEILVYRNKEGKFNYALLDFPLSTLAALVSDAIYGDFYNNEYAIRNRLDVSGQLGMWERFFPHSKTLHLTEDRFAFLLPKDCVHKTKEGLEVDWEKIDWYGENGPGRYCLKLIDQLINTATDYFLKHM